VQTLRARLPAVAADRTVLLITHDPEVAALADRVVRLRGETAEPEAP